MSMQPIWASAPFQSGFLQKEDTTSNSAELTEPVLLSGEQLYVTKAAPGGAENK